LTLKFAAVYVHNAAKVFVIISKIAAITAANAVANAFPATAARCALVAMTKNKPSVSVSGSMPQISS